MPLGGQESTTSTSYVLVLGRSSEYSLHGLHPWTNLPIFHHMVLSHFDDQRSRLEPPSIASHASFARERMICFLCCGNKGGTYVSLKLPALYYNVEECLPNCGNHPSLDRLRYRPRRPSTLSTVIDTVLRLTNTAFARLARVGLPDSLGACCRRRGQADDSWPGCVCMSNGVGYAAVPTGGSTIADDRLLP